MYYISSWAIHVNERGISGVLQAALTNNLIGASDSVWRGPGGDAVVETLEGDIADSEYAEFVDGGIVEDYLHDDD